MRLLACALVFVLGLSAPAWAQHRSHVETAGEVSPEGRAALDGFRAGLAARNADVAGESLVQFARSVVDRPGQALRLETFDLASKLAMELDPIAQLPYDVNELDWSFTINVEYLPEREVGRFPRSEADCEYILRDGGETVETRTYGVRVATGAPPATRCEMTGRGEGYFWDGMSLQHHGPGVLVLQVNFAADDAAERDRLAPHFSALLDRLAAAVRVAP